MLQKSRSKTIAKFKYLVLVPLMLVMLIFVACSEEKMQNNEKNSIVSQVQNLRAAIESKEKISHKEFELLRSLQEDYKGKVEVEVLEVIETKKYAEGAVVPFAVIDEVPVFPGCEDMETNNARKDCMSQKLIDHVKDNFNTGLGKELGLTGINRIIVFFTINKNGNVIDIKSRGPHPAFEEEAKRVIAALPQMTPGKQRGQEVNVYYTLPIAFEVDE